MKPIIIGALVGVLLLAGAFYVLTAQTRASLASVSYGEAPWPAETEHLRNRLKAIGLPALSEEGQVLHTHQQLSIYIHGTEVTVPSGIGIYERTPAFIAPVHTHDTTGVVHVESPTVQTYTLGQVFDIWGVLLNAACIGAYCTNDENALRVFVNGDEVAGDPREIELTPHAVIVVTYGTKSELPAPIPSSYTFPEGY